jgi:hypothetical protein
VAHSRTLVVAVIVLVALAPLSLGVLLVSVAGTERTEHLRTAGLTATAAGRLTELQVLRVPRPHFPWGEVFGIGLRYEYSVAGRPFEGDGLQDAFLRGRLREVRARLAAFANVPEALSEADFTNQKAIGVPVVKAAVRVAYDPADPSKSAAHLGGALRDAEAARRFEILGWILVGAGALMLLLGALLAFRFPSRAR